MTQVICQLYLCRDSSNAVFNPAKASVLPVLPEGLLYNTDADVLPSPKILLPFYVPVDVRDQTFEVLTIPQADGSFVTRTVTEHFSANGQGKTGKEALQNIKEAIELLIEESENPSGDVPWPKDCQ
jgi:predicted RNase H-like HicB family nuclease